VTTADWQALAAELDAQGGARTPRLLDPAGCRELAALYDKPELFRSTVDMARHRFGSGQYRYFSHDLPEPVRELREALYPHLLVIARDWAGRLGRAGRGAGPVAGHAGGVAGHVPSGRAGQERADPAALRGG